jgi:hypothetical protein
MALIPAISVASRAVLHVYVYIDDWLKPYRPQRPKHSKQKASISELLSIAVVGERLAQPFESTWYWLYSSAFTTFFRACPSTAATTRVLRNAEPLLAGLALSVVSKQSQLHLIDSKPCR